ncbi:cohesin domain-containing protein [Paenibacillus thiaminolyticus]|uniref:cohesin domain-containing protein n=1 Tax=Paenibacillus thiaminolyticus TaxID=49283 RepID=UPI0035A72E4C
MADPIDRGKQRSARGEIHVTYGLNGGSQNIYAQDIRVECDPAFMELIAVKSVKNGISLIDSDKKTPGKLHLIVTSQGEGNAVNGPADLLELSFRVKKEIGSNTGVISISSAVLGDEQGREAQATPSS